MTSKQRTLSFVSRMIFVVEGSQVTSLLVTLDDRLGRGIVDIELFGHLHHLTSLTLMMLPPF